MNIKKIFAANWKMHPVSLAEAKRLLSVSGDIARRGKNIETLIAPPVLFLESLRAEAKSRKYRLSLGMQDGFSVPAGAYTGAVSFAMGKSLGAAFAIVGHSERRTLFNETDSLVREKISAALALGLRVIVCVGEPVAIRKKGEKAAYRFVERQLLDAMKAIPRKHMRRVMFAYEPIWAIGSGKAMKPEKAGEMISFLKAVLTSRFGESAQMLYGGSVDGKTVRKFITEQGIDGVLVGGASANIGKLKALGKAFSA